MSTAADSIPSAAFTFDVDAEEVWLVDEPTSARRPVLRSQGGFDLRAGVPAVLGLLARHEVKATFFVPGKVAERAPDTVEAILEGGHELAHHGHTHRAPADLTVDEQVEELEAGAAALRAFGVEPLGYRAPSWDLGEESMALVAAQGFDYGSNFMDDVRAYRHADHDVIELPVHWVLDDAAHFWFSGASWTKKISTNAEVEAIMSAEATGITAIGGCTIFTFHPQIIGRPGRLPLLERLLVTAVENPALWVATAAEIAADFRKRSS